MRDLLVMTADNAEQSKITSDSDLRHLLSNPRNARELQ